MEVVAEREAIGFCDPTLCQYFDWNRVPKIVRSSLLILKTMSVFVKFSLHVIMKLRSTFKISFCISVLSKWLVLPVEFLESITNSFGTFDGLPCFYAFFQD